VLRKAPHSSQYQIPIKPNQQPVSADLWHAEHNSLIELSSFALSAPPNKQATAREDQAGQASTGNGARH